MAYRILGDDTIDSISKDLQTAALRFKAAFPGDSERRQPVHVMYGGAHLFKADTPSKMGAIALSALKTYSTSAADFARAIGLKHAESLPQEPQTYTQAEALFHSKPEALKQQHYGLWLAMTVYQRTEHKLKTEAIEDFRIDFEDGFGVRPDSEEDSFAIKAAQESARAFKQNGLPPFFGIRIKSFHEECRKRSLRTLDLYLSELLTSSGGRLPANFVVTLPKVLSSEHLRALAQALDIIEATMRLPPQSIGIEAMIEATQTFFDYDGRFNLPFFYHASHKRLTAAHFGAYDYTSSCQISAHEQSLDQLSCDFARHMMRIGFSGQPVHLADGATNVMPIGPHKIHSSASLRPNQEAENRAVVHHAWRLSYQHIRHSLHQGFYQGWDLHPHQLPVRYAACHSFFLEGLDLAIDRLRTFMSKAAQASLFGDVFDDHASGLGLLNFFVRGLSCGAVSPEEFAKTGLNPDQLKTRSFQAMLKR